MERLKEWASKHKALAIGGGLALVVLLWLLLRGGAKPADTSGVQAYYAAQAAGAQADAATQQSTNTLAAQTNQTNAQRDVALAQIAASSKPADDQLAAIMAQLNLSAYRDYLGALNMTATSTTTTGVQKYLGQGTNGDQLIYNGLPGDQSMLTDIVTGQNFANANNPNTPQIIPGTLIPFGPGPTQSAHLTTPPPTFSEFVGGHYTTATGGPIAPATTPAAA